METITDLTAIAGISMPQESISFTGPPEHLTGKVIFENNSNDDFYIENLILEHEKLRQLSNLHFDAFQVNSELRAGQRLSQRVRISLDRYTPPASYDMNVLIGGIQKEIKLTIQPNINLEFNPGELIFLKIEPGLSHQAEIQVSNYGNIQVRLFPLEKETEFSGNTLLNCFTDVIKESPRKPTMELLDTFFERVREEIENEVKVSCENKNPTLNPGETIGLKIILTLPAEIKDRQLFEGVIKIFNEKLPYQIIGSPAKRPVKKLSKKPIKKE